MSFKSITATHVVVGRHSLNFNIAANWVAFHSHPFSKIIVIALHLIWNPVQRDGKVYYVNLPGKYFNLYLVQYAYLWVIQKLEQFSLSRKVNN